MHKKLISNIFHTIVFLVLIAALNIDYVRAFTVYQTRGIVVGDEADYESRDCTTGMCIRGMLYPNGSLIVKKDGKEYSVDYPGYAVTKKAFVQGFRLTLVDTKGKRISGTKSHDFMTNYANTYNVIVNGNTTLKDRAFNINGKRNLNLIKYYRSKYSRLEILDGKRSTTSLGRYPNVTLIGNPNAGYNDITLNYMANGMSDTETLRKWIQVSLDGSSPYEVNNFVKVMERLGYDVINDNQKKYLDYFWMIEPLVYFEINHNVQTTDSSGKIKFDQYIFPYFGTVTEVAHLILEDQRLIRFDKGGSTHIVNSFTSIETYYRNYGVSIWSTYFPAVISIRKDDPDLALGENGKIIGFGPIDYESGIADKIKDFKTKHNNAYYTGEYLQVGLSDDIYKKGVGVGVGVMYLGTDKKCNINNPNHFSGTNAGPDGISCCLPQSYDKPTTLNDIKTAFNKKTTNGYDRYCNPNNKCNIAFINNFKTGDSTIKNGYDCCYFKTSDKGNHYSDISGLPPTIQSNSTLKSYLKNYATNKNLYNTCWPAVTTCDYEVTASCADCANQTDVGQSQIKDLVTGTSGKDEWQCIFESQSANNPWQTNYFEKSYGYSSRNYCSIYCKEDIKLSYPYKSLTVNNGTKITIGVDKTWGPIVAAGTKECRTTDIKYNFFEEDFTRTNNTVRDTWNTYRRLVARDKAVTSSSVVSTNSSCGCVYNSSETDPKGMAHSYSCCKSVSISSYACTKTVGSATCIKDAKGVEKCTCSSGTLSGKSCTEPDTCYTSSCSSIDNTYHSSYSSVSYSYIDADGSRKTGSEGQICVSSYFSGVSSAYSNYNSAVAERAKTVAAINNCSNWTNADNYNDNEFKPVIKVSYDDEVYSLSKNTLKSELSSSTTNKTYNTSSSWVLNEPSKNSILGYECANDSCIKKHTNYPSSKQVGATYNKVFNYVLQDELFRYIIKPTNESVSTRPGNENFIDVGYSNLPISLSSNGKYDISLNLTSFGSNNKLNSFIFGINKSYLTGNCKTAYECEYQVNQNIQIPKGLNVIFRPISLSNPFPGISGTNRTPGSNWSNPNDVSKYITNNRDVQKERVYFDKDPMYEITLTPATILKIRKYNSLTTYDDFDMKCTIGQKCKSNFIRNSDFSNLFKGCGIGKSSRCNAGESW